MDSQQAALAGKNMFSNYESALRKNKIRKLGIEYFKIQEKFEVSNTQETKQINQCEENFNLESEDAEEMILDQKVDLQNEKSKFQQIEVSEDSVVENFSQEDSPQNIIQESKFSLVIQNEQLQNQKSIFLEESGQQETSQYIMVQPRAKIKKQSSKSVLFLDSNQQVKTEFENFRKQPRASPYKNQSSKSVAFFVQNMHESDSKMEALRKSRMELFGSELDEIEIPWSKNDQIFPKVQSESEPEEPIKVNMKINASIIKRPSQNTFKNLRYSRYSNSSDQESEPFVVPQSVFSTRYEKEILISELNSIISPGFKLKKRKNDRHVVTSEFSSIIPSKEIRKDKELLVSELSSSPTSPEPNNKKKFNHQFPNYDLSMENKLKQSNFSKKQMHEQTIEQIVRELQPKKTLVCQGTQTPQQVTDPLKITKPISYSQPETQQYFQQFSISQKNSQLLPALRLIKQDNLDQEHKQPQRKKKLKPCIPNFTKPPLQKSLRAHKLGKQKLQQFQDETPVKLSFFQLRNSSVPNTLQKSQLFRKHAETPLCQRFQKAHSTQSIQQLYNQQAIKQASPHSGNKLNLTYKMPSNNNVHFQTKVREMHSNYIPNKSIHKTDSTIKLNQSKLSGMSSIQHGSPQTKFLQIRSNSVQNDEESELVKAIKARIARIVKM